MTCRIGRAFIHCLLFGFLVSSPLPGLAAPITLDGDLGDWTPLDRLDPAPGQSLPGYALYGRYENATFYLAMQTDGTLIGPLTTIWLNTDEDQATGYQIFGFAGGAEFNVNVFADQQPYLYTGAAAETFVSGPLAHAYGAGGTVLELAIPESSIGSPPGSVGLLYDFNDVVFLPTDYSTGFQYTIRTTPFPPRTDFSKRVGIVHSQSTADLFFDEKAYAQLFQSLQHQAMMAGIPFDLLTESEITDIGNLVNYDALVFPYFANVPAAASTQIADTLFDAVYRYRIGILTAGDFMTNDETGAALGGDPYARMKLLLGLQRVAGTGPVDFTVSAADVSHPVMRDYAADEPILGYEQAWYGSYDAVPGQTATVLADQQIGVDVFNAIVAAESGGRHVHFGAVPYLGDGNVAWSALQWMVYGDETPVGLKLGRNDLLFLSRNDMDQSMYADVVADAEVPLLGLLTDWKSDYGFVGSYYINIGNDPGSGQYTDWGFSGPLYQSYMALGNEIGTHSYTHPFTIDLLTPAELEFEFNQSALEIGAQLGTPVIGGAVPGNPESLATDVTIGAWLSYLSGTYASAGSGYPGAFGYLTPDFDMVYFNISMLPDFTLIEFLGYSAFEAEQLWQSQFQALTSHASQPIVQWMWHDYGPTVSLPDGYSVEMYENTIAMAHAAGAEFTTLADAYERIKVHEQARLLVTEDDAITAQVESNDAGRFSLRVSTDQQIARVDDWYAYDDRSVFLPRDGGTFTIRLGTAAEERTRIVELPMRAELISLAGDGDELDFTVHGEGSVAVQLRPDPPAGTNYWPVGAAGNSLDGDLMTVELGGVDTHSVSVILNQAPLADAGPDQAVSCTAPGEALVTLDASASTDPDLDGLTHTWIGPFGQVTTPDPATDVTVPVGVHAITLSVDDMRGGTDTDLITIDFPVPVELCDGLDDDCDGTADNGAGPPPSVGALAMGPGGTLSWTPLSGASGYDVSKGDLGLLSASGGDFGAATIACLESDTAGTGTVDADDPGGGGAFYYLVRARGCGQLGDYDTDGGGQLASRSVPSCP